MNEIEISLYESSYHKLSLAFEELMTLKNSPVKFLDEFFKTMHDKIIKEKSQLINSIELIYKKMVDSLKLFEYECHNVLHQRDFCYYNFDNFSKIVHDLGVSLENKENMELVKAECETIEKEILENIEDIKSNLLLYTECKFEENSVHFETLGHLKIEKKVFYKQN